MQTRSRTRHAATSASGLLPSLPVPVQLAILDRAAAAYPVPDAEDYTAIWPFKSSLGWLLSMRLVCQEWNQHLQQLPILIRRVRLEQLRNLCLIHDYAYYIVTRRASKQQRIKAVPRSVCLHFADGTSTTFSVPRGGVVGSSNSRQGQQQQQGAATNSSGSAGTATAETQGLPTHALMLVAAAKDLTTTALQELLGDLDILDSQHAASMVLKVCNSKCGSSSNDAGAAEDAEEAMFPAQCLVAAVRPLLHGPLKDVVLEGDAASPAMYFIPTKQGFCRRVAAS